MHPGENIHHGMSMKKAQKSSYLSDANTPLFLKFLIVGRKRGTPRVETIFLFQVLKGP